MVRACSHFQVVLVLCLDQSADCLSLGWKAKRPAKHDTPRHQKSVCLRVDPSTLLPCPSCRSAFLLDTCVSARELTAPSIMVILSTVLPFVSVDLFCCLKGFSARDFEAMRRISAWISLEPDAGARKNNRYPDDRHPGVTSSPSFSRKIPGETASVAAGSRRPAAETRKLEPGGGDCPRPGEREADGYSGGGPGEAREGTWTEQFSGEGEDSLERAGETNGGHSPSPPWHATAAPSLMSASTPSSLQSPTSDNANANTSIGDGSEVFVPLTPSEKAAAARGCKRLLDRGRRAFIEKRLGLRSEIVHFVGSDVTPENALLLGFRAEEGS